ncbi:MAG: hypothetical protein ABR950_03330 [Candidatus Dormibacteria bacterium]|jgi:hypothetical protein
MRSLHRTTRRLAPVLSLSAGLVLGAGIGLPTAHWVAGFLTRTPAIVGSSGYQGQPSATAEPRPSSTATPVAVATPGSTPTLSPAACSPLATGQQPLDSLRPPASGYTADSALDWIGCGTESLPATTGFTVGGVWVAALSYTCPAGTAAASTGATLTVSATSALAGSGATVILQGRTDSSDVTAGSAIGPGTYRLSVAGPLACLWHLAVYRG